MRYFLSDIEKIKAMNRQEALDRGVDPNAVTQEWYDYKETVNPGVWSLMVYDDKNPVQGETTTTTEPEWPLPPEI